ncbi:succinate dehydrogenase subunit 3-2, mitochondrial-like [Zingiber officinale]|uniref:succinate dehydrogenase subunit 3-2, mitochondrial-like n=1 Tax=Zingiber officinale TaxID=94328 RepID=UPI001C4AE463|nr:succinate dehydrogenase subunit 3-2, mitochondrial-like [Zingiber officinale]
MLLPTAITRPPIARLVLGQSTTLALDREKMEKNARFTVHADASFSLRGFLNGTSGYPKMARVHQKLPNGCQSLSKRLHGSTFISEPQPTISTYGCRSIHVTRTLSEATRGIVSNRPLSPHLPVKKPQLRATFSISHRIFGASLTSAILLIPIAWKFSLLLDV